MTRYLFIESRDPFEHGAVHDNYELAASLARSGAEVEVFLVQNGVLPARRGARSEAFEDLLASGVAVAADDFSLRERAIAVEALAGDVRPTSIEHCVDRMAEGARLLWS